MDKKVMDALITLERVVMHNLEKAVEAGYKKTDEANDKLDGEFLCTKIHNEFDSFTRKIENGLDLPAKISKDIEYELADCGFDISESFIALQIWKKVHAEVVRRYNASRKEENTNRGICTSMSITRKIAESDKHVQNRSSGVSSSKN